MSTKSQFGSKIGLIAATVGSAIGLGNVWRFPAETQANGGAAFLLLYIACVFVLGIPVMLAEFSLGRAGRSDAVGVFHFLSPGKKWWIIGAVAIVASYLILCYYMVVAGWTAEYLWQSITGNLYDTGAILEQNGDFSAADAAFSARMNQYICNDISPLIFTFAVIVVNIFVLLGGVQKGIERLSNIMMPLLFVLLLALCAVTLSLPGAGAGLEFFLSPDFSKINAATVINALGQTFFSLSLGMGILITYSSYYPADTKLTRTSLIVSLMSLLVAVMMGCIIFPAVTTFGLDRHPLEGATLVFVTLPEVFSQLPATQLWSVIFFLLLFVAALTSTVSIAEVSIAFMHDRFGMSRFKSCMIVMLPLFILSTLCSLSFGSLNSFRIFDMTIFDSLDAFTTNVLLPLVSMGVCIYVGWFAPKGLLKSQITNNGTIKSRITSVVLVIIRYFAPILIAAIMISKLI
ncbi:MAG: sodium-dependent transporter [Muribaculaceae bacterium]|nr:sodium-dependent transporter [Muribaculaceae bacterium]